VDEFAVPIMPANDLDATLSFPEHHDQPATP
jgi:hypothetical protein